MEASAGPQGRPPEPAKSERPEDRAAQEPKHPHRKLVWALVVLASIVLVVSMLANWVQTQVLNSGEFSNSTEQILQNKDVQQQLSIFAVDQLYANVDVQAQIEQRLPPPAQPLAAPVTAATRQLATNVAKTALASPQVQQLVATAINGAQQRFVSLIEDKGKFVSTQGGDVTLEYGSFVADLASRLGVDPSTISEIQGFIQQSSTELKQRLTTVQGKIESTRSTLSQAQAGKLTPQAQQNLTTLETDAGQLATTVGSLEQKIATIQPKAPAPLQARLSDLQGRLAKLGIRLTTVQGQAAAVIKVPSQANIIKLDPTLASLQTRVTDLLNRQAIQHPGEIVIMKSSGLSGLQDLVKVLRNLGFVLAAAGAGSVPGIHLPGEGLAAGDTDRGRGRDPGRRAARPLGEAPDRGRGRRLGGELRRGQTGRHLRLEHHFRRPARSGAVRARDRVGIHRRGAPRRARPA